MDIVYSIDDNFIPQAAALTASVLEQAGLSGSAEGAGPSSYRFHILSNGIREANRERFAKLIREQGAEACFYDMGDFEGRLEQLLGEKPETGHFAKASLGRIFAAEYLPGEIKRALYLDADMIARKDLRELWNLELNPQEIPEKNAAGMPGKTAAETPEEGKGEETAGWQPRPYILGACAEPTIYEALMVEQGPSPAEKSSGSKAYFNSGLLLIDLEAWRKEEITKKCLDWYRKHNGKTAFADQDILNHVLAGRILPLDQKWNFQTNYYYREYDSLVKQAPWYGRLYTREAYEKAAADPAIVHYAGDERPWIRGNRNPYRKEFEQALEKTSWKDTPQTTGREGYMQFYHLVNVLSSRFPGFRAAISKIYYQTKIVK